MITKEEASGMVSNALGARECELEVNDHPAGPVAVVKRQGRAMSVHFLEGAEGIYPELLRDLVTQYDKQDWTVTL